MNSCLYKGILKHARYHPVENFFRYKLFMMFFDLSELDDLFNDKWFWSVDRFNLAYLRRADHFGDQNTSIEQSVRNLVIDKTGTSPKGPIKMLTHLRYFGHCFNPATFYYCYDETGQFLEAIVVEIHNTPWGEVYCYVLDYGLLDRDGNKRKCTINKQFHVSPFIGMDILYNWNFTDPGEELKVHMIDYQGDLKLFEAELTLDRKEISGTSLASALATYPLITVKIIAAIYWQAFKLWKKGAPFYENPGTKKQVEV